MKKVLILAYDFPPYVSVGGLRPYNWYKYFSKYGIEPIVVTRQWENKHGSYLDYISASQSSKVLKEESPLGTIIRSPYKENLGNILLRKFGPKKFKLVRKIISAYFEIVQYFYVIGPKAQVYRAAKDYLKNNEVDYIIATGDPFVLFFYANKLSSQFNIDWIADYRDPWSFNTQNNKGKALNYFNRYLEKKLTKTAKLVFAVSDFVGEGIHNFFPDKEVITLPNGYDPELVTIAKKTTPKKEILRVGFAGTIYKWNPVHYFLEGINTWLKANHNALIEFLFIGVNIQDELEEYINIHFPHLKNKFTFKKKMQYDKLLVELASCHALLLFNYYSYMGTKIFDYLGLQRKILLCYSQDEVALQLKFRHYTVNENPKFSNQLQADLITQTNSGIVVRDQSHLLHTLTELYREFCETGKITLNSNNIDDFSREIQVKKMADRIKKL